MVVSEVVRSRRGIVKPNVVRAWRVLAEPMAMRARSEFVEPKVRAHCVLAMCYGDIALGVYL